MRVRDVFLLRLLEDSISCCMGCTPEGDKMGAPCIWASIFHEAISTLHNALKPAVEEAASGQQKGGFTVGEGKEKKWKTRERSRER
jgi:hypothetical protein